MIGKRIKKLRKEKRVTLKQLGEVLNLGESTISMYENGKRSPDYDTLIKLSEFFNVSTDYLLGQTDVKNNTDKISDALEDDEELLEFWEELKERENLQLLFKQTRNLDDKGIQQIIRIIKAIEDEESREM